MRDGFTGFQQLYKVRASPQPATATLTSPSLRTIRLWWKSTTRCTTIEKPRYSWVRMQERCCCESQWNEAIVVGEAQRRSSAERTQSQSMRRQHPVPSRNATPWTSAHTYRCRSYPRVTGGNRSWAGGARAPKSLGCKFDMMAPR